MNATVTAAASDRRSGRWLFRLKVALIRLLMAALVIGYCAVWSFQFGPYAAVAMTVGAVALVVLWNWVADRRVTRKVRHLLEARTFPVNIEADPPIKTARLDAWLLLRGTPRGMGVDLTNQLIWLPFDDRSIHALRPSGVSSIDIVDGKSLLGQPQRELWLIDPDAMESFTIIDGDEVKFRESMARLLEAQGFGALTLAPSA